MIFLRTHGNALLFLGFQCLASAFKCFEDVAQELWMSIAATIVFIFSLLKLSSSFCCFKVRFFW